jgi:hypothetical protein
MGFKKGRKKTVRRLLRLAALFKAQSALSSTAGPTPTLSLPPWSLSHLEAIACHMAVDPLTGERQNISTLPWSLSHLEAVACHCVQGMAVAPLTRERQNIRTLLKGISFYSYFYQRAISLPGLRCSTLPHVLFHDVLCLAIADVSEPSKQHCKDTR